MSARSRSAARLAAVQALYQQEMEGTAIPVLLARIPRPSPRRDDRGRGICRCRGDLLRRSGEGRGCAPRRDRCGDHGPPRRGLDARPARSARCARSCAAGAYELIARRDVPTGTVINEYLDVADAFYAKREKGFVGGLLDAVAKAARADPARGRRGRGRLHRGPARVATHPAARGCATMPPSSATSC